MYDSEFCSVRYLDDLNVVLVTWKKFCSGEDYRKPLIYAINRMNEHPCCNFVADTRDGFEDDPADLNGSSTSSHSGPPPVRAYLLHYRQGQRLKRLEAQPAAETYFKVHPCFDLDRLKFEGKLTHMCKGGLYGRLCHSTTRHGAFICLNLR